MTRVVAMLWSAPVVLLAALVALLMLHNGCWTRSGDGEVYLGIAISLVDGRGFQFNGQPVAMVPPGWPLAIAGLLLVTDSFACLKLLPLLSAWGGIACAYACVRSLCGAKLAAGVAVLMPFMGQLYQPAIWFHSDAPFFFLALASFAIAFRIRASDRAPGIAMIALLSLTCALAVSVRWNGVLTWGTMAAIMVGRLDWSRLRARLPALIVSGASVAIAFLAFRMLLRVDPASIDPRYDAFLAGAYDLSSLPRTSGELADRLANIGRWPGGLLWHGFNLGGGSLTRTACNIAGWGVFALVVVASATRLWRDRDFVGLSIVVHVVFLAVLWPRVIPRYVLPLLPFFVAFVVIALPLVLRRERLVRLAGGAFALSLVAMNVPLYVNELVVQRSGTAFPSRYQGGIYGELAVMANLLRAQEDVRTGRAEVAVSRLFDYRSGDAPTSMPTTTLADGSPAPLPLYTSGHMRTLHVLLGRPVMTVPDALSRWPDDEVLAWCRANGATYYVYLEPARVQPALHRSDPHEGNRWHAFRVEASGFVELFVPDEASLPIRVPLRLGSGA